MKETHVFARVARRIASTYNRGSIRYVIFVSFTMIALFAIVLTGGTFYARFSSQLENTLYGENQMLVEQVTQSLNAYLRNMRWISDTISYRAVKNRDVPSVEANESLLLLYEANTNYIRNIGVYNDAGELLAIAPPALLRENVDVTQEEWFTRALHQSENQHFSMPSVQNLYMDAGTGTKTQYNWIVSLSSYIEITQNKSVRRGVLLIDLRYDALAELFENVALSNEGYVYLIDTDGTILYHPHHQLISSGLMQEANMDLASLRDGEYTQQIRGEECAVIVRKVGYTGWSVVGVIPHRGLMMGGGQNILFVLIILALYFAIIIVVNAYVSNKITDPISQLELSMQKLEKNIAGAEVYVGGSHEIRHLGRTIQQMVNQLKKLTDDIVAEQAQKQKSELNALQAQINPHFLYNTLDILVWMIEKQQPEDALKIVSALGRFFRLSLSKGKNIITVQDELEHVRNYLMIQQMRYKNKFTYTIEAEEGTLELSSIKLVLQPLVENAIYHGIEFMNEGEGTIDIRAYLRQGDLYLSVRDNGLGMPKETVARLLTEHVPVSIGSGIGLKNVHERIMLYFGEGYGVEIHSELDEGTLILLHLPAIPYAEAEKYDRKA
ncbi:MAG: sensor histidine kinase [Christensenellaceae bacterium]|jgi:two-component system sensor histidine kinase YesM|nr:sensor histidine kinase [Christensenellaceae bacterium]